MANKIPDQVFDEISGDGVVGRRAMKSRGIIGAYRRLRHPYEASHGWRLDFMFCLFLLHAQREAIDRRREDLSAEIGGRKSIDSLEKDFKERMEQDLSDLEIWEGEWEEYYRWYRHKLYRLVSVRKTGRFLKRNWKWFIGGLSVLGAIFSILGFIY